MKKMVIVLCGKFTIWQFCLSLSVCYFGLRRIKLCHFQSNCGVRLPSVFVVLFIYSDNMLNCLHAEHNSNFWIISHFSRIFSMVIFHLSRNYASYRLLIRNVELGKLLVWRLEQWTFQRHILIITKNYLLS